MIETLKDREVDLYEDFGNRYLRCDDRFDIERDALKRIPVIDISPFIRDSGLAARRRVGRELRKVCISIPFFVSPQGATVIRCLETCQGPGNAPRYAPVTAGDYVPYSAGAVRPHRTPRCCRSYRRAIPQGVRSWSTHSTLI